MKRFVQIWPDSVSRKYIPLFVTLFFLSGFFTTLSAQGDYTAIISGYDWGPAVNKVVLTLDAPTQTADFRQYSVFAVRQTDCVDLPPAVASGQRRVVHAYVSDAEGNNIEQGEHLTLVLAVAPNDPLGSPIQYTRNDQCSGNNWINYKMTIVNQQTGHTWNQEINRIRPLIDDYDLSGKFSHEGIDLTYAWYTPKVSDRKKPLIIWLHGGGEGGTDPSIALIANRAANYASEEIQAYFGGAYVLAPQTPTYWMDSGSGYTRGDKEDIYHEALFALFEDFVKAHPDIDTDRIYVGGCSNGGYMSLKLILEHPDYFAASYISALAYHAENLTDQQLKSIRHVPIWFVHAADDGTTRPEDTVLPTYQRLKAAGAKKVYCSYYDHVTDITGFYGGEDYQYPGHWSWIYSHANVATKDMDGTYVKIDDKPVTIMEWLAAQER